MRGGTLTKISQATGLGKASLYHYFPKGKAEMVETALSCLGQWFEANVLKSRAIAPSFIEDDRTNMRAKTIAKFELMCCEKLALFFNEGENSCLWTVLLMEQSSDDLFHAQIYQAYSMWIRAIAQVLIASGLDRRSARERGEDAETVIQGALIVSHGLRDFSHFQRILKNLLQQLYRGI